MSEADLSKINDIHAAREAFHIAKLALLNVHPLSDMENESQDSSEVARFIKKRALKDKASLPVSLMHQGTFMQFGYVCMAWLWELSKVERHSDKILAEASNRFDFSSAIGRKSGERNIDKPCDVVRIIRNAISHARVSVINE
jgi:hypothetical protein